MTQTNDTFNPFDPAGLFKSARDSGMDAWSKVMIQFVNTESYAQAIGAMLDAWLTTSAPFRKAVESAMTQSLVNLNMPTRDDVTRLAERLTNIELRLDDLDAKLDGGQGAARRGAAELAERLNGLAARVEALGAKSGEGHRGARRGNGPHHPHGSEEGSQ